MYSKLKRRFKSKGVQQDYRYNWIEILTKHILCECECIFDGKNVIPINGGKWNCNCNCKNLIVKMENI